MQEVNWGIFRAKFNGREQATFQWLCYLLFCKQFGQNLGIARLQNHAGIESSPIEVSGKWIGWQAKFYEGRLSEHKGEFIASIDLAKSRHPELTRIQFYINLDFGQAAKETDPQYKLDIEAHARTKGVSIDWMTASFFEAPFVAEENAAVARYFFSWDVSIIDLIRELDKHSDLVLNAVRSSIQFGSHQIRIDRSAVTEALASALNDPSPLIISGEGGAGKTAVIKDLREVVKNAVPIFVFKATEFNTIRNINDLFRSYGDVSLYDLVAACADMSEKCVVIDSAERLSDIEDSTVFQEFLTVLLHNGWKLIFTTRRSYLDDLRYLLIHIYGLKFQASDIGTIEPDELVKLSKTYGFALPGNERLKCLLCNPFYLNEYLQNYDGFEGDVTYSQFKNILWEKQITKSSYRADNTHIRRAECFLGLAQKRANDGAFFVKEDGFDPVILSKLVADEVLGHDATVGGYFISHDIYEEWALERIIERSCHEHSELPDFYAQFGSSLPVRRAFRRWLSDMLLVDAESAKALVERTIRDAGLDAHWQDEVLVSTLLSDHCQAFFALFENELLADDCALLVKITFLLRIACKEVDDESMRLLGIQQSDPVELKTVLTKPRGSGWIHTIEFIHRYKERIGVSQSTAIVPVLEDWNLRHKRGKTTREAAQIALFCYEETASSRRYYRGPRELQEKLIGIILNGAVELKNEIGEIVDQIASEQAVDYGKKYVELANAMLSSALTSFEVAHAIPEKLIKLAGLFWAKEPRDGDQDMDSTLGVGHYYGLADDPLKYFPSSAFQTPTFSLLRCAPWQTVEFILSFTNAAASRYAASALDQDVREISICIDPSTRVLQHYSNRLWNTYRGTQVSPHLLESIHMALEKWLLEYAKTASETDLERLCLHLLQNATSASITAVVVSITLAQPSKLFGVAKVLFQTKELFLYDTNRLVLDQTKKHGLEMLKGFSRHGEDRIFENERIRACDEQHRRDTLENLAVRYQMFGEEEVVKSRQQDIWAIFDRYDEQLPTGPNETEADKTWRMYLARMDRRKMSLTTEQRGDQILISLNPELDPELQKFSEDALKRSSDAMKHSSLKLWAHYGWERNDEKRAAYEQYEGQPQRVLDEIQVILNERSADSGLFAGMYNDDIPAYACAVLVRDYAGELSAQSKEYCKDVLISYAVRPLQEQYDYQLGDGVEPAIGALPLLFGFAAHERRTIKVLLFIHLLGYHAAASHAGPGDHALRAIVNGLWNISPDEAHSLFLGYLLLKPLYDEVLIEVRKENYNSGVFQISRKVVAEVFEERYGDELARLIDNAIQYDELKKIESCDLSVLAAAFELVPLYARNPDHQNYVRLIVPIFAEKLLKDDDELDYTLTHRFLQRLAFFVLSSEKEPIQAYLQPFLDQFSTSEAMADLLKQFVYAQDRLARYEEFWEVWQLFYDSIVKDCQAYSGYRETQSVVRNYLFAGSPWNDSAKSWHTLQDREKAFFKKVADDIGGAPVVLYALSLLLNGIGSDFVDDGIVWISDILEKHAFLPEQVEINTVYYLENILRRFIYRNRTRIRRARSLKQRILKILEFLIANGSVVAYLTREDII